MARLNVLKGGGIIQNSYIVPSTTSFNVNRLDAPMKVLEQKLARHRSADGDSVSFFNLGFCSKEESDA